MKILLISELSALSLIYAGGASSFFIKFININKRAKNKIFIVVERKNYKIFKERLIDHEITLITAPNRSKIFYKPYFNIFYECWVWNFCIKKIKSDILVVSNSTPWINFTYIFFAKKMLYFMHTYPSKLIDLRSPLIWLLSRLLSDRKRIATVSKYSRKEISGYAKISEKKISVIHNSYDKKYNYFNKEYKNIPIVLTVGGVVSYKNPELWLVVAMEVIKILPTVQFWWIGEGDMLAFMRSKVSALNLKNNVKFFGYSNNVDRFYSNASVYFQPSLIESHGIAVIEAMIFKIPLVVSNVGGLPESVLSEKSGFLCNYNDIDCFTSNIIKLLTDNNLAEKYGTLGEKIAKNRFNEKIQEQKILKLLDTICQK